MLIGGSTSQRASANARTSLPLRKAAFPMLKISVVDDDASVRAALDNLLSSHGYYVDTFVSAEAFLQSADLQKASCVIADIQMPGMSGLDLLKHMRVHGHDVPFIFITAFPNEGVRTRALQGGAICFLAKPFAVLDLIDCVKSALS
jgi:FixJ family two-component response regulator